MTPTSTSDTGGIGTMSIDVLPPAPSLVSPPDGASEVPLVTSLCWQPVVEPEGQPLRYRVFIDDTELTSGILGGVPGYEGPCVGPLNFMLGRTYTWRVMAFEADDPTHVSPSSVTWSFSTPPEVAVETVFADDFNGDGRGWKVSGDTPSGAWIHGKPVRTFDGEALAQPGGCFGGTGCYFTGQNPAGVPDQADVAGGTTVLTSPAFDLGGATAATVQLARFFYKSEATPGPRLTIELLVPADGPDGYDAHLLEELTAPSAGTTDNLWWPREYVACGVPMADGSRLRISATDTGGGLLEAAIDSIKVRAHANALVCGSGEGGACDPALDAACPADLLCCSQGVINEGVHRCTPPAAGLDFENPPPNVDDPGNGPLGCDAPDLIVDNRWLFPIFTQIAVTIETCEYYEGCVGDLGARTVMLFTAATPNVGSADLVMGVPANHPELFQYSPCHDHYHFDEFARYQLLLGEDVAALGHKQAFCMLDTTSWAWPLAPAKFNCANQGISRGFSDFYDAGLPCQWIDITGVPPGEYTLRISVNNPRPETALRVLNERDYSNNVADVVVSIP
ncbi:MAG: hypothetical protein JNL82_11530 [Myxococcales bacterium]|nr:hypothetical protein [Myxococcales bacterium]